MVLRLQNYGFKAAHSNFLRLQNSNFLRLRIVTFSARRLKTHMIMMKQFWSRGFGTGASDCFNFGIVVMHLQQLD
jgi:hypothetical protein